MPYSTDSNGDVHCQCVPGYEIREGACQLKQTISKPPSKSKPLSKNQKCAAEKKKVEFERERINRLLETGRAGQEEMREWQKMNDEAQREALFDAAKYFAGEYAANLAKSRKTLSELEDRANKLAAGVERYGSRAKARKQYAAELASLLNDMRPQVRDVIGREAAKHALDMDKAWELGRDTLHADVAAAATQSEKLRAFLSDPKVKEAFSMDLDTQAANAEAFKTTADAVLDHAVENARFLKRFSKITGPSVRAGEFVVDMTYDLSKNYLSAQRVVQQSDVAGDFAKATASLQKQFESTVDALEDCRSGG